MNRRDGLRGATFERGHPLLDERFGFAIGCCESVCYGDFTAAVSAGVTPAFDNGWPRLVSLV